LREVSGEAQSLGLLFFVYVGDIEAMDRVFQEGEWFRTLVLWRNGSFLHYLKTSLRPLGKILGDVPRSRTLRCALSKV